MNQSTTSHPGRIVLNSIACYSEIGQKDNQEDTPFPAIGTALADSQRIFVVCDGMGGHENGEVASACVAKTVGEITQAQPLCDTATMRTTFERALATAYDRLDEIDTPPSTGRTMGTTLTFLALCTDGILTAHIGDSRIYHLRQGQGVKFHTRDHSLVNDLISAGELSEEEARTFPQRNVITRAIQPHQEHRDRASFNVISDILAGDVFLLCSDGVIEQLDDNDLAQRLLGEGSLGDRLHAVAEACQQRHTHDNNTAYAIEISQGISVAVRPVQPRKHAAPKIPLWIIVLVAAAIGAAATCLYFFRAKPSATGGTQHKPQTEQRTTKPLVPIQHP